MRGGQNYNGIKWMAWDRLCEVKEGGGLSFKKLRDFNIAMLAKQAWRLMNNSNPSVTKLMKARYYAKTDFLDATLGTNPSFMWRSIMASQDIMKQWGRRKIGNGRDTRVWHIPWLPCVENGFLTTDVQSELETTIVNTLIHDNGIEWGDDILSSLFNDIDRQLILQIPLSSRNTNDSWYWLLDNDGVFSVMSCYRRIRGEREYADRSFWKKLWRIKLPGKVLNFLWRVCRNVLPTAVALVSKHVNIQQVCSWCHFQNEDTMHTFFSCGFAKEVWYSMGLQRLLPNCDEITVLQIFKQVFSANSSEVCAIFGLICWALWIRRNSWVWSRKSMSVFGVTAMVTNLLQDWKRSQKEQRHMPSGIQ